MSSHKDRKFYVYVYLDQRISGCWNFNKLTFKFRPFYVGVGSGYRETAHLTPFNVNSNNSIKNKLIRKIISELGVPPVHARIYENLELSKALELEREFISLFGKLIDKTGCLANVTDGGEGRSGPVHSEKFLNKLRKKVYQYGLDGEFIKEWVCLKDAQNYYGVSVKQAISKKGTSYGFQWRFERLRRISPKAPRTPGVNARYKFILGKNGQDIQEFTSFAEICEFFGRKISFGSLSMACSKKNTYLGYEWRKYK